MTRSSLQSQPCFINWRLSNAHRPQASRVTSFRTIFFLLFYFSERTERDQCAGRDRIQAAFDVSLRTRRDRAAWTNLRAISQPPPPFVVYNARRTPQYKKADGWHCHILSLRGALRVQRSARWTSGSEGSCYHSDSGLLCCCLIVSERVSQSKVESPVNVLAPLWMYCSVKVWSLRAEGSLLLNTKLSERSIRCSVSRLCW